MACELVTTTIQDKLVTVTQLNCTDGLGELSKLLKVTGKLAYEYLNGEANIHHHLALLQEATPEDLEYIKNTVCKCAIEGKKYTPDTVGFYAQNNYLLLMEVFAFFMKANFKEFFIEGLKELASKNEMLELQEQQKLQTKPD